MNIFGDSSIGTGDLAMVVRDCCGRYLGTPLKVSRVFTVELPAWCVCGLCNREYSNIGLVEVAKPHRLYYVPLFWLKKIDPPAIAEDTEQKEELHA